LTGEVCLDHCLTSAGYRLSKLTSSEKAGFKEKNIPKKAHKNIIFLLHFLIEDISVDKYSKNLNGVFFLLRSLQTVCQNGQFRRHIAIL